MIRLKQTELNVDDYKKAQPSVLSSSFFHPNLWKIIGFILVAIFFIVPIIRLILMSFIGDTGFTLSFYKSILAEPRTWQVLKNTVIVVAGSTILASILGIIFAWIVAYTDIRGKNIIQVFIFMPFVIPSYVTSLAWVQFFGPKGFVDRLLAIFPFDIPTWNLYSLSGIIFVMGISHFPLVYLFTVNVLRQIPREMELAARISGASAGNRSGKSFSQLHYRNCWGHVYFLLGSLDNFGIPAF